MICLVISLLLQQPGVHSKCYFQAQAPCHYEGKYFSLVSQHPIDFPAGCEVRQEAGTCQFSLVQKSDPRLPCKGGGPDPEWGSANTPAPGAPAPHSS
ncbi:Prostate-associated microseminoprotein [Vulpes lagopus]